MRPVPKKYAFKMRCGQVSTAYGSTAIRDRFSIDERVPDSRHSAGWHGSSQTHAFISVPLGCPRIENVLG